MIHFSKLFNENFNQIIVPTLLLLELTRPSDFCSSVRGREETWIGTWQTLRKSGDSHLQAVHKEQKEPLRW